MSSGKSLWVGECFNQWRCGVVVIATSQRHSRKSELISSTGSNLARGVSKIRDGEELW